MSSFGVPRMRRIWHCRQLCLLAVATVIPTFASAAPSELTLEQAMVVATSGPRVEALAARLAAAEADADRAGRWPDPVLEMGIENLPVTGSDAFQLGADEMTMRRVGVMQEWPSRRKRDARRAAAIAQTEVARAELVGTRNGVARAAGEAWLEVWAAEADLSGLRRQIQDGNRAVEIAAAQLKGGTGSAASALAAKSTRAELEREQRELEARVQAARAGLARWLGEPAETPSLAEPPDFNRLATAPEVLRAQVDRLAALRVWDPRERAADASVELARAEKRSNVDVGLSYGARSAGLSDMATIEVRVGLPIFARHRQDQDIAARIAERDAVRAEREEAEREQRESLDRTIVRWEGLREQREQYEATLLPLARDREAVALAAYASGDAIEPWLAARQDSGALRRRYVQTLSELGRTWLALATLMPLETSDGVSP